MHSRPPHRLTGASARTEALLAAGKALADAVERDLDDPRRRVSATVKDAFLDYKKAETEMLALRKAR